MAEEPIPDRGNMPPMTNPSSVLNARLERIEAMLQQILDTLGAPTKGGGLGH